MLSGHSAVQEIKHLWKFTSGFTGPQIDNVERGLSLSPGTQDSLDPPCKISLGCPIVKAHWKYFHKTFEDTTSLRHLLKSVCDVTSLLSRTSKGN